MSADDSGSGRVHVHAHAACKYACRHADCRMERGDALPGIVARAWWPDGTEYVPRAGEVAVEEVAVGEVAVGAATPTRSDMAAPLDRDPEDGQASSIDLADEGTT